MTELAFINKNASNIVQTRPSSACFKYMEKLLIKTPDVKKGTSEYLEGTTTPQNLSDRTRILDKELRRCYAGCPMVLIPTVFGAMVSLQFL